MSNTGLDPTTRLELITQRLELLVSEFKQSVLENNKRIERLEDRVDIIERDQERFRAQITTALAIIGLLWPVVLAWIQHSFWR